MGREMATGRNALPLVLLILGSMVRGGKIMDHHCPTLAAHDDRRPGLFLKRQWELGEALHEGECLLMSFEIVH
tara:strand:+ start:32794 stop:33012 length:219 start_codon:yes stop_codon:yes gene_type:complete